MSNGACTAGASSTHMARRESDGEPRSWIDPALCIIIAHPRVHREQGCCSTVFDEREDIVYAQTVESDGWGYEPIRKRTVYTGSRMGCSSRPVAHLWQVEGKALRRKAARCRI